MSRGHSGKFSRRQCKFHLSMDRLGEQKVLESSFFELSKSLKSKILSVGTIVPPPRNTGFITNLPFWATWKHGGWNVCVTRFSNSSHLHIPVSLLISKVMCIALHVHQVKFSLNYVIIDQIFILMNYFFLFVVLTCWPSNFQLTFNWMRNMSMVLFD